MSPSAPSAAAARTKPPYAALKRRDFAVLWASGGVSMTGSQMQLAALNWHVWMLTRDPLMLGLVGLTRVIPVIVFSLWGGVFADRMNRRALMATAQGTMTLAAFVLAWATSTGRDAVWLLFTINAITGAATAFDNPARQAMIPRLVPRDEIPGALALNLATFHAAWLLGPVLCGVILGGGTFGPTTRAASPSVVAHDSGGLALVYLLNAISFLPVITALGILRASGRPEAGSGGHAHPWESLKAGLRFVFTTPIMVWTMTLDFFATLFAGAMSMLPIYADDILHVGVGGYGWLYAAPAFGAVLGSIWTSIRPLPARQGRVILWSVAAFGAATIVWGLSRDYVLTWIALAATGLADLLSTIVRHTLRQLKTPEALLGRMTSVNMIFFMGGPQLGEFEAGLVARLFATAALGATVSVVSGGVATLVVVAVVASATRVVREYVSPAAGREDR